MEQLTRAERERLASWALLARIARYRGAGSALPGEFPADVEAEYQRLRGVYEALKRAGAAADEGAHERFRGEARALLRRLEPDEPDE